MTNMNKHDMRVYDYYMHVVRAYRRDAYTHRYMRDVSREMINVARQHIERARHVRMNAHRYNVEQRT
jgi:hypothetical protein